MVHIERILIVGGGIAGLTLATALHQQGLNAELVERSPTWQVTGTGILLHANGMRILHNLDLGEAVEQAGTVVHHWGFFDQQGEILCNTDLDAMWGQVDVCIGITRPQLQQALLACSTAVPCRLDTSATSLAQDEQSVRVEFSDGSLGEYELVVGADGLHSTVRELMQYSASPGYTGVAIWRSLVPICPQGMTQMMILLGEGGFFGLMPMGNGCTYGFGGVREPRSLDAVNGRLEYIRQLFASFAGPVPEYLAALSSEDQLHRNLIEAVELDQWYKSRVVLIGDAAHAGPPMMAQGGCMAMEDAYVLAELLQTTDTLENALTNYVSRRRPRTDWVQQQSRAAGESFLSPSALRNATFCEQGNQDMYDRFRPLIPEA